MRALVTGAAGFIGAHVVTALSQAGAAVIAFDRAPPPEPAPAFTSTPASASASSCATCGPVPGRRATERDLPAPAELHVPYKRTKRDAERLAIEAAKDGADVIIVNPAVPVGPGDRRPTPTGTSWRSSGAGRPSATCSAASRSCSCSTRCEPAVSPTQPRKLGGTR
jgi:nucleoside-diphosphate-sugar epimerase